MAAYEIIVQGHLGGHSSRWFDGLTLEQLPNGRTRITGPDMDQATLHGILARIRDLGVPLISLNQEAAHYEEGSEDHR